MKRASPSVLDSVFHIENLIMKEAEAEHGIHGGLGSSTCVCVCVSSDCLMTASHTLHSAVSTFIRRPNHAVSRPTPASAGTSSAVPLVSPCLECS